MPSGPKKRMKLRRKKTLKEGSPAADANSDKETEGLSISGSMDVDEIDTDDVDTPTTAKPGDRRAGPTFDDKDALSSQTEEWVRVSDFDVGTPTSQTGENEPISEDADISSVRRSLDKLAEWESVSGDNIPGKRDGSVNSLDEEPSEIEVEESALEGASGHSSESFMHLPSPKPIQEKDTDMDRRSTRSDTSTSGSSSSSSSSSSDAQSKTPVIEKSDENLRCDYASVVKHGGEGEDEETTKSSGDPVEKEIVHESSSGADTSSPEEREMNVDEAVNSEEAKQDAADTPEGQQGQEEHAEPEDVISSTSGFEPPEADEQRDKTAVETIPAASPVEEKEITASAAKDITEVATPLNTPVESPVSPGETPEEVKQVLSPQEEPLIPTDHEQLPGPDEKKWLEAAYSDEKPANPSIVDVEEDVRSEDKEVASLSSGDKEEERKSISSSGPSATAVEDKEVASSSAETEELKTVANDKQEERESISRSSAETEGAKKVSADVPSYESATTIHETKAPSGNHTELTLDTASFKPLPRSSDEEEQLGVVVERHASIDTTQPTAGKNEIVTGTLRPQMEPKSLSGCCGVIYWLLGRDQ